MTHISALFRCFEKLRDVLIVCLPHLFKYGNILKLILVTNLYLATIQNEKDGVMIETYSYDMGVCVSFLRGKLLLSAMKYLPEMTGRRRFPSW